LVDSVWYLVEMQIKRVWAVEDEIATHCFRSVRNDKYENTKTNTKDVGMSGWDCFAGLALLKPVRNDKKRTYFYILKNEKCSNKTVFLILFIDEIYDYFNHYVFFFR
jgi:hypothetical protein